MELEVAPAVVPYLPAGHSVHEEEPAVGLYDPALQFAQVALEVAPVADENLPAGQGVGSVAPARQ